jgi:hypothetical protein
MRFSSTPPPPLLPPLKTYFQNSSECFSNIITGLYGAIGRTDQKLQKKILIVEVVTGLLAAPGLLTEIFYFPSGATPSQQSDILLL